MKKSELLTNIETIMNRPVTYYLDKRKAGYRMKVEGEATLDQLELLQNLANVTKVENRRFTFTYYIEYKRCQNPYKEASYYPAICIYLSKKPSEC